MPLLDPSKILFIINPISGGNAKNEWEQVIHRYFAGLPFSIDLFILDGKNDEASVGFWIEKIKPGRIVAVGGDGTVSLAASKILGTGIALGIIPAGSANGMAKELQLPDDIEAAMKIIAEGKCRDADVIRINNEHICLHLSDIGLNALLVKHFEEGKVRGILGYAKNVLKTLWTKTMMKVHIRTNEEEAEHSALMVVLANASKYGTGAVINPDGNIYDGKFEVVIMKRLALSELLKMWFKPQPFNPQKIKIFPATSVTITTKRKAHFQVDGEYLGKLKNVEATILAGQLKLIVP